MAQRQADLIGRDLTVTITIDDAEERAFLKSSGFRWTGKGWTIHCSSAAALRAHLVPMIAERGYTLTDIDMLAGHVYAALADDGVDYDDMIVTTRPGGPRLKADRLRGLADEHRAAVAARVAVRS